MIKTEGVCAEGIIHYCLSYCGWDEEHYHMFYVEWYSNAILVCQLFYKMQHAIENKAIFEGPSYHSHTFLSV